MVSVAVDMQYRMINTLEKFLKKAVQEGGEFKQPEYHMLFKCGTIVRFQIDEEAKFKGFHSKPYKFPKHRVNPLSLIPEFLNQNQQTFERLVHNYPDYEQAIHTGYNMLILDGYPYPGGEGADRVPFEIDDNVSFVYFPHRSQYVFNLVDFSHVDTLITAKHMGDTGANFRRYDYMFPKAIALFTPKIEVIRFEPFEE